MKRLLLTGLLLLGIGQMVSFAQTDDIYFNSADIEKQKQEDKKAEQEAKQKAQENEDNYSSSGQGSSSDGGYQSYSKSYDNDGYVDYNNDDYYYSSRIRRFNYPFYNMSYYSAFHNPYWYDPYWSDPYWGWSAWNRPGFSVSFGYGPYWSSYWGWYTWYGYPAYYSYWDYPYYANPYGSYYSGYWNGYYAGLYNNYGGRRVTYGPRNSTNYAYNTGIRPGLRTVVNPGGASSVSNPRLRPAATGVNGASVEQPGRITNAATTGRPEVRPNAAISTDRDERDVRYNSSDRSGITTDRSNVTTERPSRGVFSRDENEGPRYNTDRQSVREDRPVYQERVRTERPVYQAPRQEQVREQRYEQPRQQPRFESPRYEAPRMSNPSPAPVQRGGGSFGGRR